MSQAYDFIDNAAVISKRHRQVADLIIDYLAQLSVDYVFGVPGGAIEPLYNALAHSARKGGPRAVVARHETGAAFMADGYYRETGKLGVCCGTTGPGTTNLLTGVASAYENHIPMLVISAQTALSHFGRGALQESSCTGVDTVGILRYCTRYSTLISHVDQFEHKFAAAVMAAFGSPHGPAHLSVPLDILRHPLPGATPLYDLAPHILPPSLFDRDITHKLCGQIEQARKPVFVIGGGCGEARSQILALAGRLRAPVVATPNGKGHVSSDFPLFKGVIGFAGHETARETLADPEVDLVVAMGTALGEWESCGWNPDLLMNNRLIHIDPNEHHLMRSPVARLQVRGRILSIFDYLLEYFKNHGEAGLPKGGADAADAASHDTRLHFRLDEEHKYADTSAPIKPQRLMRELVDIFPRNTCFLADAGNSQAWAIHYLHPFGCEPSAQSAHGSDRLRHCMEFDSMGWAIGAAVGTALGNPQQPVVCITGDGSLLMSGQEISVAVQEKLPIIFVVLNDSALGMVKHGQRLRQSEAVAFELPATDFRAYAEAMGATGHVIRSPADLRALDIAALCARSGPTVLDVRIDPDEVPPIAMRIEILGIDDEIG
ncbi:acetolactate synthase-1/2/3 large subunit [Methylomagnum ishizawai]|uniref:Acetolactate synthase-1/2/3 large subunit n=1 Tax=Methylomagnum ishizawai TaxID=1760988 RepID=A0A1Y6D6M0_9GAMM|nr:thiamine pyrophosphate-binding protein [Methylomagnum ishizawai]SMF95545.1 acetolactate synthase-1/2/3 large subunit [Methylomagnum ishizawai]